LAQAHKNRSEDHPQNINLTQTPKNHPKQNKNPRPNRLLSRIYPVELKTTDIDRDLHNIHHHMQLTCQALLLEERFGYPVYDAKIIYYDELRKRLIMHKDIEITVDMKTTILKAASDLERSYRSEIIPPTPTHKEKCQGCEFWHICRSS
ncbi:MAG TPA: Dna2/Cas4 domain-containing protein, partial [Patescibacteria group bacterium]|nr:Dna2/Cas4 domain-containing protein [Patescibacteria group bacterium]